MKLLRCSVLLFLMTPMVLSAQELPRRFPRGGPGGPGGPGASGGPGGAPTSGDATTRPWWPGGGRGGYYRGGGDESFIRFRRGGPMSSDAQPEMPTDEQWSEVAAYMQRELPNTWRHFQAVSDEKKDDLKKQIYAKFRETQGLRERNENELYDLKLKEAKLADDFSGLVREWRRAPLADKPVVQQKLRGKAREILEVQFAQRDVRIKRLEDQLKGERDRLASSRSRVDELVERRMDELVSRVQKDADGKPDGKPADKPSNRQPDKDLPAQAQPPQGAPTNASP